MKMTKIALAVATLAAAPAAFALTPAQIDGTTARLWLSGASAPTVSVFKGVMTLCKGMTYKDALGVTHTNPPPLDAHIYLESATAGALPGGAGDRLAYTCTVGTDDLRAGTLEGKKVVVFHTVEGGSFNAYSPHLRIAGDTNVNLPTSLRRTSNIEGLGAVGQCAAGAPQTVAVDISGLPNNIGVYRACATTPQTFAAGQVRRANVFLNPDRPEGGFSDTEYTINQLNLNVASDLGVIGGEVPTNIGQAFGVAVSLPLYRQLQLRDEIITSVALNGEICDGVYFDDARNCVPSMPSLRYTAIANRDSVFGKDGSIFGGPVGSKVHLARRAITSGTQSASNLRFLNKPCATGVPGGALEPTRSTTPTGGNVVVTENSSTGGVKTALTAASNIPAGTVGNAEVGQPGQYAMGVVSMENVPGPTEKWAFVDLDDVSPTGADDLKQREAAMEGSYDFWYELVAFTATTAFPEGVDLIAAANTSLGNPGITDLTGLFITSAAGVTGANVGLGTRGGFSCQKPVQ